MEKTNALMVAVIGIIFSAIRLTRSYSLVCMIISFCSFTRWTITLDRSLLCHSLFSTWRGWAEVQEGQNSTIAGVSAPLEPCPDQVNEKTTHIVRGEVEVVMEMLGFFYDPSGDEIKEKQGSDDIADLFDEKEVRLEEVKEAFDVFDENSDGFIDGNELEKVLCKLGFEGYSGEDCEGMIGAFDENGDGVIDFSEFVKLLENSYC